MRWVLCAGCLVAGVSTTHAAERLNIRTGLWEVTTESQIRGMPPMPKELLDQLTPEQRAQMEAEIEAQADSAPQTEVSRECVTEADLERPFETADAEDCEQTIVRTTRTTQEVRLVCTGEFKGSGTFKLHAPDRETMEGDLDLTLGEGKQSMSVKAHMRGRWLGTECGEEGEYEDSDEEEAEAEG